MGGHFAIIDKILGAADYGGILRHGVAALFWIYRRGWSATGMVVDVFYFQFHGIVRMWDYVLVVE